MRSSFSVPSGVYDVWCEGKYIVLILITVSAATADCGKYSSNNLHYRKNPRTIGEQKPLRKSRLQSLDYAQCDGNAGFID